MTTQQVLLPTSGGSVSVRVHPVALFSMCDAYLRRSEKQERVIRTLLGVEVEKNVLEVKSCYVVPHTESSEQVCFWRNGGVREHVRAYIEQTLSACAVCVCAS